VGHRVELEVAGRQGEEGVVPTDADLEECAEETKRPDDEDSAETYRSGYKGGRLVSSMSMREGKAEKWEERTDVLTGVDGHTPLTGDDVSRLHKLIWRRPRRAI
jgi:hypothetical protein